MKTEYVIKMGVDEVETFYASSEEAARRRVRKFLRGEAVGCEPVKATLCKPMGKCGQWLDEIAVITIRRKTPAK
jgi:hypothetical protein